jgi:hypothetical protein
MHLTKITEACEPGSDRPATSVDETEITPAMIEAGADAIASRLSGEDVFNLYSPEETAVAVYRAMHSRLART